jgi:serine/threonine protein kinase
MERFVREAKSAAALNHLNIAHIYEIGESKGTYFIAMEFVEGVTPREKIHGERSRMLSTSRRLNPIRDNWPRSVTNWRTSVTVRACFWKSTICWSQTSTYRISCRQSPRPSGQ